ncbi:winged helix-turn-helix transcriptional regulator [Streptomyces sp. NPDC053048]|uniref:winged helix-turn-helix transcriptional regulator n=1 Tax=Streptomyces sp. NPDC053048 TaxID=3365694 RepID=UPI0037D66E7A
MAHQSLQTLHSFTGGLVTALHVIGGKWKPIILTELRRRPLRFGELRRAIPGVSEKVLSQQLREMELDGVVNRDVCPQTVPRAVQYSLTELGITLHESLRPLAAWGEEHELRMLRPSG